MEAYTYHMPTRVVFGNGGFAQLGEFGRDYGRKPLIVTGKHSARNTGILDRATAQFDEVAVFDEVEENPNSTTCDRGAALCREQQCDLVIALGGGSPMDAAKAIAGLARNPGRCVDYYGRDRFTQGALPIIAVPTTAGTGSEVTPYAVIINADENMKRTLAGNVLFPQLALLDPELTVSLPRSVTVATGLDALSQAMEGMASVKTTPVSDALALEACRTVRANLPAAADSPEDLDARGAMLHAACLSGMVIAQTGTTLVHGMGYYLTIEFGILHGMANAFLLPSVFQFNAQHIPERVAALAEALGHPAEATPEDAGEKIVDAVYDLFSELSVSAAARNMGFDVARLDRMAAHVYSDASRFKNQVGTPSLDDVQRFFKNACEGTIS